MTNASNTPLTDAEGNAQQVLSAGQRLDVAWTMVDPSNANYSLTLPLGAPNKAPYVASGPLVFTVDAAAAGKYGILGSASGYTSQTTAPAVTLTTANNVTTKDLVLAP